WVTNTTATVAPPSARLIAARCSSSSGPGPMTTITGPASSSQVLVPGPVEGPGLGATTRRTEATNAGHGPGGRCAGSIAGWDRGATPEPWTLPRGRAAHPPP